MSTPIHQLPGIIDLPANQPLDRPYFGGSGIAAFRGIPQRDDRCPEDFLGSTTEVFSGGGVGLTVLSDGRTLRDAVADEPEGFLGPDLAAHLPAGSTGLLTKLLSTDAALFIHAHPDDAYARQHGLGCCGKTESWFILAVDDDAPGEVLLGFTRDVSQTELADWFETQNVAAMSAAMHRFRVRPGDTVHVPAGVPHGIGPGITLLELQQPTDLSILLEYAGYPGLNRADALLGLTVDTALAAFSSTALDTDALRTLREVRPTIGRIQLLFPADTHEFYGAERVHPGATAATLDAGFAIAVVIGGSGRIASARHALPVERGRVLLVRHDAGPVTVDPGLDVVFCRPAPVPHTVGTPQDS
ncbi:class I mannose-6-phosphate isomerase [Leucobacter japonicus]|uniref:class I mannose-6-phosphate isomerase n=1 Tax=Leucobacter japonicus TaxID=1461259 RepID=UPI0006A79242|nr:class I mannose-6-phosphate isomerase [Leucobacter japonicus]